MKKLFLALYISFFLLGSACVGTKEICIDESKINREAICTRIYQPVCGCNSKTYGNQCEAEAAGLTAWTSGACK